MPVLKTKSIPSLEAYIGYIEALQKRVKEPLWYRGCGKLSHILRPSLYRHRTSQGIDDLMRLEKLLLERFRQRSIPFHPRTAVDNWEWLFLMQHYGVPTRLLDWSESPLMALFFAVISAPHTLGSHGKPIFAADAAVWILNPIQWNKRVVSLKTFHGSILTADDPNANAYKPVGDVSTMKEYPIALYGTHNSQRIVAQRGVFVCFGKDTRAMERIYTDSPFPVDALVRLTIPRGKLSNLYDALRRHGLTDSVVFPDLDGLAREIKREHAFDV